VNRIICIFSLLLFAFSCKNDHQVSKKTIDIENVLGTWDVIHSTRNNRVANSLSNAAFVITDTTFSCNFLDASKSFPYSFDGKGIKVLNPSKSIYSVRLLTPDTLLLASEIKNFDFKFTSVKRAQND
jgi:hypothetical protein